MEKSNFYGNHITLKNSLTTLLHKLVELEHQFEDASDEEVTELTESLNKCLGDNLFGLLCEIQQTIPQKMSFNDAWDWGSERPIPDISTRVQRAKEDAKYRNWLRNASPDELF